MFTHANKTQQNKTRSVANSVAQKKTSGTSSFQFVDNRPQAIAQRKLQEKANNSPQEKQAAQLQAFAANHPAQQQQPSRKKASLEPSIRENNTGLPDNLKSGIENLSGYSMDDVKVHYNSEQPKKLQAHAYAQGTDIHLASGQEKHLPHEAWHVVQQMQGRVKPTMQMKGKVNVNDDVGLEKEAEVMGETALQYMYNRHESIAQRKLQEFANNSPRAMQLKAIPKIAYKSLESKQVAQLRGRVTDVVQRLEEGDIIGKNDRKTLNKIKDKYNKDLGSDKPLYEYADDDFDYHFQQANSLPELETLVDAAIKKAKQRAESKEPVETREEQGTRDEGNRPEASSSAEAPKTGAHIQQSEKKAKQKRNKGKPIPLAAIMETGKGNDWDRGSAAVKSSEGVKALPGKKYDGPPLGHGKPKQNPRDIIEKINSWNQEKQDGCDAGNITKDEVETIDQWARAQKTVSGKDKFAILYGEGTEKYTGRYQMKIIGFRQDKDKGKNLTYHITLPDEAINWGLK